MLPIEDQPDLLDDIAADDLTPEQRTHERRVVAARRLIKAREEKDATEAVFKRAEAKFKQEQGAFWEAMHDSSETTVTLELGDPYGKVQFQRRQTVRGRVLDKVRARESLEKLHLTQAITEPVAIRQGALNDHVREWLKNGDPIPDGLDFSRTRFVTITRKS